MKIIFMGTPDLAAQVLEALVRDGQDICLAVTQPDRMKGRGRKVIMTPVKECALSRGIPVFQPEKVKDPDAVARLKEEKPDLIVVAAFGQILSQEVLDIPKYGCVNVHTSLLPKYRGAAPIQWAIINGEKKSGVTIMQMDAGLDTGDILLQEETELAPDETAGSLTDRLAKMGGDLLIKALPMIEAGTLHPVVQRDKPTTYAKMLHKDMGDLDWEKPAEELGRLVRGLNPWPCAYTYYNGKLLKIWKSEVVQEGTGDARPGTVTKVTKDSIFVATGNGTLALEEVQLAGKKRMPVQAFLLGCHVKAGDRFDRSAS